jgi:hypothetical protein
MKTRFRYSVSALLLLVLPVSWADDSNALLLFETAIEVQETELDMATGMGDVDFLTHNQATLGALISDTSANNNTNGFNIIDSGSFSGASGMVSVIQNTGNNVIIQDSTIVNVTIVP